MESSPQGRSLSYILKNKDLVQAHVEKHKKSWDPDASEPSTDQGPGASVSVYVRVRPLLAHDVEQDSYSLSAVQPPRTIHYTHPTLRWAGGRFATKTYEADGVFGEMENSESVYSRMGVEESLGQCVAVPGKELYVLAYGQTGTGKTFTTTYIEEKLVTDLFSKIASLNQGIIIHVSIFEIRGPNAYDLLSSPPFSPVKVAATSSPNAVYPGLSEHTAPSAEDLLQFVKTAASLRFTRSTTKNDTSSRSHAIVRFRLSFEDQTQPASNIYIVDLAGSERAAHSTQNEEPDRRKEAIETNKSLAVLKDCIRSRLSVGTEGAGVASWRGSKLTTVLKRAFERDSGGGGGDTRLVVIACVSPSAVDCEDSLNTLNYVTPFRLAGREAVDASDFGDKSLGSKQSSDVTEWDHEQSKVYITRTFQKLAPFVNRLLPTPEMTITSLIGLTQPELSTLLSTPIPSDSASAKDPKLLAQAKSHLPSYHSRLQRLASPSPSKENESTKSKTKAKPMASTRQSSLAAASALKALSGKELTANETGPVTRLDRNLNEWSLKTRGDAM